MKQDVFSGSKHQWDYKAVQISLLKKINIMQLVLFSFISIATAFARWSVCCSHVRKQQHAARDRSFVRLNSRIVISAEHGSFWNLLSDTKCTFFERQGHVLQVDCFRENFWTSIFRFVMKQRLLFQISGSAASAFHQIIRLIQIYLLNQCTEKTIWRHHNSFPRHEDIISFNILQDKKRERLQSMPVLKMNPTSSCTMI